MHESIRCLICGEMIEAHWELMEHRDCTPGDGPRARRDKAAAAAREAALQAEFRAMDRRNQERIANLRLLGTGLHVRLGEDG
jgi:hypothetical protein